MSAVYVLKSQFSIINLYIINRKMAFERYKLSSYGSYYSIVVIVKEHHIHSIT